ncbi:MAG: hypothetical protein ACOZNI_13840 [Myxococcota bacterium]
MWGIILLAAIARAQEEEHGPPRILDQAERRDASGTAWQPDTTPMHGFMGKAGEFDWMAHANVFAMYDWQGSERGDGEFGSANWVMAGVGRGVGSADFDARAMLSLEPVTVGPEGYPLVGQTGESWQGEPLTDRQHPHDLLMEASLRYRQAFGTGFGTELYVAPAGEPALGPVAFPHRASAISDPVAPLGHHWQDSTHITYGVLTAGLFVPFGKIEGSWFNGREPDETRYDLDLRAPDSWSARLTVVPVKAVTAQVSYGYLASPEALHPDRSVDRLTASVTVNRSLAGEGNWATTAVWGRNVEEGDASDSALLESNFSAGRHVNLFGRAEYVVKSAEDLQVVGAPAARDYGLAGLSLGHVYTFEPVPSWMFGVGVRGGVTMVPEALEDEYGTRFPVGGLVYLQARPAEHKMTGMRRKAGHHASRRSAPM